MIKKDFTYTNFDGEQVTETWWFHLFKSEMIKMHMYDPSGDLEAMLKRIVADGKPKEIIDTFDSIIKLAVGKRSADGKRFIRNQELIDEFFQTPSYDEFFCQLVTDANFAVEFLRGAFKGTLTDEQLDRVEAAGTVKTDIQDTVELPTGPPELEIVADTQHAPTPAEIAKYREWAAKND